MTKPEWKDAPSWAEYLTYDCTGWVWWQKEPEWDYMYREWYCTSGKYLVAQSLTITSSKEKRPENV